jgi:hypothetical protein
MNRRAFLLLGAVALNATALAGVSGSAFAGRPTFPLWVRVKVLSIEEQAVRPQDGRPIEPAVKHFLAKGEIIASSPVLGLSEGDVVDLAFSVDAQKPQNPRYPMTLSVGESRTLLVSGSGRSLRWNGGGTPTT